VSHTLSSLASLALLAGCASSYSGDPRPSTETTPFARLAPSAAADALEPAAFAPTAAGGATEPLFAAAALGNTTDFSDLLASPALELAPLTLTNAPTLASLPRYEDRRDDGGNNYLTAKLGEIYPSDSSLDSGWIVGAAYGRNFSRLFAIEVAASYFEPDTKFGQSADMYAVPLMLNARVNLPIWLLQIYGGLGIGGIYYNIDGSSLDGDGWLAAGNAFLGADITVFDKLSAGLEVRYFVTDKIRNSDVNLDGVALALTLGFRF
jgi:opacity protein-like surface antigen